MTRRIRKALESKRKNVETLTAKVPEAEKAMNEGNGRISTAEALVETKKGEIDNAMKKALELIVGNWQINWKESPKEFATTLTSSAREYSH